MTTTEPINFYEVIPSRFNRQVRNPYIDEHHISLPLLCGVVGSSGAGKTNWLANFLQLFRMFATFDTITIVLKNRDEPIYNALAEAYPQIVFCEIHTEKVRGKKTLVGMPNIDDFKVEENNLVIFDDVVGESSQDQFEAYFLRARKRSCSCIYMSQSYFRMPIFVRLQCMMLFILKLSSDGDLNRILREYAIGINRDDLLAIYRYCTRTKFNFLTIDIKAEVDRRYRHNFLTVIDINDR